jgi:ribonuclease G
VKSTLTVCYELVRELTKIIQNCDGNKIFIYAHPEVTAQLCGEDIDFIETLENQFGKSLLIRSENNYHIEQYEIFPQ